MSSDFFHYEHFKQRHRELAAEAQREALTEHLAGEGWLRRLWHRLTATRAVPRSRASFKPCRDCHS